MHASTVIAFLLVAAAAAWALGRTRALASAGGRSSQLHSLPAHYGSYALVWSVVPAVVVILLWVSMETTVIHRILLSELPATVQAEDASRLSLFFNDVENTLQGRMVTGSHAPDLVQHAADRLRELRSAGDTGLWIVILALVAGGFAWAWRNINPRKRARDAVERLMLWVLMGCSLIAILTTVGIVLSVLFESIRFFEKVPITEFLFGLHWSPQTAIRADQVGGSGSFGAVPLFAGTALIALIAMLVSAPVGLMSAIYLSEYAHPRTRAILKPMLEILAGVPTVVYGFFAALVVAPFLRDTGTWLGLDVASESALAAGVVMGIMIIPFVSSLSDDVISAVPRAMREGSYGIGATQSETIRRVLIPAALPGIVGGLLLAVSRAIGETMIVVMAAGLAANLTANPLEAVTTVTVQIVTLLVGDQEFDSAKTLAAFALGLVLFIITLILNVIALVVVRKYREQYE